VETQHLLRLHFLFLGDKNLNDAYFFDDYFCIYKNNIIFAVENIPQEYYLIDIEDVIFLLTF